MLFRHQEEKKITLYAKNMHCLEIKNELKQKGGSKAINGLAVSDIKVCNHNGRYNIEVHVQSLFQRSKRIGIDKFVREAMPIQEEEKASGKPAAKARPRLQPSSISGWDFTPMEHRQWIDIEIKESKETI